MFRDLEVQTVATQLQGMAGLPEPVRAARDAVLNLRGRPSPAPDLVSPARHALLNQVVTQAAGGPVDPKDINVRPLFDARRAQAEADDRARLLADAAPLARARFTQAVRASEPEVVELLQTEHRSVIGKLWAAINVNPTVTAKEAAASGEAARQWATVTDLAGEAERLRRLVGTISSQAPSPVSLSFGWTCSTRVYDGRRFGGGPGPDTKYGEPGSPEFYVNLYRDGAEVDEMWAPTPKQCDQHAAEEVEAEQRARASRAPEFARSVAHNFGV